jgi:hypothetical protein
MKNILNAVFVCGVAGVASAQMPKVKVPTSNTQAAQTKQVEKPFDQHGKLLGKDISEVMKIANIKDTVGPPRNYSVSIKTNWYGLDPGHKLNIE